jgi:hypothetical protein
MAKDQQGPRKGALGTLQQIALDSGVPYSSVRELVLDGHVPSVKLGDSKRYWIKWSDWDRYIAASTETAEQR